MSDPANSAGDSPSPDLPTLISDLSPSSHLDAQSRAALSLRLLFKHSPANRLAAAALGAVPALAALASYPDPLLQEHSVTALLNLSLSPSLLPLLLSSAAPRHLVSALKSGPSPAARANAACALFRLSHSADARSRVGIGRLGAMPALVSLLESGDARGRKDAVTALYGLCCGCRENTVRAVDAGAVVVLVDAMANAELKLVEKAGFVVRAVAEEAEGRRAVAAEGGIEVLVEVVESGTAREKEVAVAALLRVCGEEGEGYRGMAVREGALPPLVELSQSPAAAAGARRKAEELIELLRRPRSAGGVEAAR